MRVATGRAVAAGILRRNRQHITTGPLRFIFELAAKLAPALIQNRTVQTRFLPDISTWLFSSTRSGTTHVTDLQILDTQQRVAFAEAV